MNAALEGAGLNKTYRARRSGSQLLWRRSEIAALRDVAVRLEAGSTLALVGESGSGKSTLGRILAMMEAPDSGALRFEGREANDFARAERLPLRRSIQVIFQDPYESLDPRFTIGESIEEPLLTLDLSKDERLERVRDALTSVELAPPERYLNQKPHQLSGGQRQRVAIARAIVLRPKVLIADEPTSMLDVSLRIGILKLLADIRNRSQIAVLLITHDLAIARHASERVMVMYAGRIVESGSTATVLSAPNHPYTRLLLAAAPRLRPGRTRVRAPARAQAIGDGCPFAPRCSEQLPECLQTRPRLASAGVDHLSACLVNTRGATTDRGIY